MSPARRGSADQRPRIRTLKPERWHEEEIGGLSRDARLLYDVLWTLADDEGRLRASPALVIGHGYPYDEDVTPAKVRKWIGEIEASGLLVTYTSSNRPYIWLRRFVDDQVIDRRRASVLPPPPVADVSTNDRRAGTVSVDDALTAPRAGGGSDRNGSEIPPSPPAGGSVVFPPPPPPSKSRRQRDMSRAAAAQAEHRLAVNAFAAEHFPAEHPDAVLNTAAMLRHRRIEPTVDAICAGLEAAREPLEPS